MVKGCAGSTVYPRWLTPGMRITDLLVFACKSTTVPYQRSVSFLEGDWAILGHFVKHCFHHRKKFKSLCEHYWPAKICHTPFWNPKYATVNDDDYILEWVVPGGPTIPGLPGLPGSIRRLSCHGWPSAGEKSLKLINTPSHTPNDGQASPCLNSHSTHIPILIACSILCLVLPHHCPIHAPQSIDLSLFLKAWVHVFPWAFRYSPDETTKIHSSLKTLTHNLTPLLCKISP